MMFSAWGRWLKRLALAIDGKLPKKSPYRRQLEVEPLEDRVTPSGGVIMTPFLVRNHHPDLPKNRPAARHRLHLRLRLHAAAITTAYGISQLTDQGSGQTIAVIDAYDDPNISSNLKKFDTEFGLPAPPTFSQVSQTGGSVSGVTTDAKAGTDWSGEESLDVEWANSIAPKANIIVVECNSASSSDLFAGETWAASSTGGKASVVSMSFGYSGYDCSSSVENYDADFSSATYPGVTFLASADDHGSSGPAAKSTLQAAYPSDSPNVISVGGTSININTNTGAYNSEGVWNDENGSSTVSNDWATGGGISNFEAAPIYQQNLTISNGSGTISAGRFMRAAPDVSFLASDETGVDVYDSYNGNGGWGVYGGTSLSSPCWAGLVAIADEARVNDGEPTLSGSTQALPILYNIYNSSSYSQDFNDINSTASPENNNDITPNADNVNSAGGYTAGTGYDLVSGIGTPIANNLVPGLADTTQLIYVAPSGTNNFTLVQKGANLDLYDNGTAAADLVATDPLSQLTSVYINGASDNTLTIDYSGGAFSNVTNIAFAGGPGTGTHSLTLENGTFTSETYNYSSATSGTIGNGNGQLITYTETSSIADNDTLTNLSLNLPSGAKATLEDTGATNDGVSKVVASNTSFAQTTFESPSHTFTVNTAGGSSVVKLYAMDTLFKPATEALTGKSGDTFLVESSGTIYSLSAVTLTTATLDMNGFNPTMDALNGTGTITDGAATASLLTFGANNGTGTFSGLIQNGSGTVSVVKDGTGTETLSYSSGDTYTGTTTISLGTLKIGATDEISSSSSVSVNATFDLNGFSDTIANFSGKSSGVLTNSGTGIETLTFGTGTNATYSGLIENGVALTKNGNGTETLAGADNTYTGATTINAGTIKLGATNAISDASDVTDDGTLDMNSYSDTIGTLSGNSGSLVTSSVVGAVTLTVGATNDSGTFSGLIENGSGTVALTMDGSGTETLAGFNNTYSGATTISAGTLKVGAVDAIPFESNVTDDGTLDMDDNSVTIGTLSGSAAGLVTSSTAGAVTLTLDNYDNATFSGVIQDGTGPVSLTIAGTATETLAGLNTYSGATTISAGTLQIGISNALPSTSDVTDDGTLDLNGFSTTTGALSGVAGGLVTSSVPGV